MIRTTTIKFNSIFNPIQSNPICLYPNGTQLTAFPLLLCLLFVASSYRRIRIVVTIILVVSMRPVPAYLPPQLQPQSRHNHATINVRAVCFVRCHCKQIGAYASVVRFDLMIVRVLLVSMGPFWYQTVAWYGFVVAIRTAFVGLICLYRKQQTAYNTAYNLQLACVPAAAAAAVAGALVLVLVVRMKFYPTPPPLSSSSQIFPLPLSTRSSFLPSFLPPFLPHHMKPFVRQTAHGNPPVPTSTAAC